MKTNRLFGYVRVSSKDQNMDRQVNAMQAFGVDRQMLVMEKETGKDFERPQYKRLLRRLRHGDTLVVKSIDRLGRNYCEIIEQWRLITKEKEVDIVVLDMPLLDTRKKENGLTGMFIADLVLQILSYVAQSERENIRQRQEEGIAAAKARGVKFGRPPKPIPPNFHSLYEKWAKGDISMRKASAKLNISPSTFNKWVRSCNKRSL